MSKGEEEERKGRGRERKRKGKGEREIGSEALAETEKKIANAPAGVVCDFSPSRLGRLPFFPFLPKLRFQFPSPPFPSSFFLFLFLSFPLPLPSTFRLRFKISLFAFIPLKEVQVAVLVRLSELRPVGCKVGFLHETRRMAGCATALVNVVGRCLASCLSCSRGRRVCSYTSSEEAPTANDIDQERRPHQPEQTSEQQKRLQEVELQERNEDQASTPSSAADIVDVSKLFKQMERELAASLENLDAVGRIWRANHESGSAARFLLVFVKSSDFISCSALSSHFMSFHTAPAPFSRSSPLSPTHMLTL